MSSGIHNIRSNGNLLNAYEFQWDPKKETKLFVIVSGLALNTLVLGQPFIAS